MCVHAHVCVCVCVCVCVSPNAQLLGDLQGLSLGHHLLDVLHLLGRKLHLTLTRLLAGSQCRPSCLDPGEIEWKRGNWVISRGNDREEGVKMWQQSYTFHLQNYAHVTRPYLHVHVHVYCYPSVPFSDALGTLSNGPSAFIYFITLAIREPLFSTNAANIHTCTMSVWLKT